MSFFSKFIFSNAALSFDIHRSAQRRFYISMFHVLLAEDLWQNIFSSSIKTET